MAPFFLDRFGEVIESGQYWREADSHDYLAVYNTDADLRLAWASRLPTGGSSGTGLSRTRTVARLLVNGFCIARLTQACSTEDEFNSLTSALADVLGRVVQPGQVAPPQRAALEAVRDYLASALDGDAAGRVTGALDTLIRLRRIRASTQHSNARRRAVTAFQEIGLSFPPPSWEHAWAHIAVQAGVPWTSSGRRSMRALRGNEQAPGRQATVLALACDAARR